MTIKKITEKQYDELRDNIRDAAATALECTGLRGEVWMDLSTGDSTCNSLTSQTYVNPTKYEELVFWADPCPIEDWLNMTMAEKEKADADAQPEYKDLEDWFLNNDDPNDNSLNQTSIADVFLNEYDIEVDYKKGR